jgi:site-specific DNA recombinase
MRIAIYARYSSELQDTRSIADQVSLARQRAEREGWIVVGTYEDAAISGASAVNRPGLSAMMAAAAGGAFDAVLTESLDRLSRDLEDMAGLHKRLAFLGIKIVTLADGEVGKLHVGVKGLIASLYLEDLAQKTRRGQLGRVAAGRIPGGRCYGYDVVASVEDRGLRTINSAEADVVRRIFREYVAGRSPISIVRDLNREGVPPPRGAVWNASTLNGSRKRANGILSNSLYVGEIVYKRQRFIKDPATGKRQARPNPESEWRRQSVPELAIVERALWDAASARRESTGGPIVAHRRPKRLLSGLMTCGCCGGSYIMRTAKYAGCSKNMNSGSCNNGSYTSIDEIERRVVEAIRQHLLSPAAVEVAVEAYREERARLARERLAKARSVERDRGELTRRIERMVTAIEEGEGDPRELGKRLRELERRRRDLDDANPRPAAEPVTLHPQAARRYLEKVEAIHAALSEGAKLGSEAAGYFRELAMEIRVTPKGRGEPPAIDIVGDLASFLQPEGTSIKVVAGVGFEPTTFRL